MLKYLMPVAHLYLFNPLSFLHLQLENHHVGCAALKEKTFPVLHRLCALLMPSTPKHFGNDRRQPISQKIEDKREIFLLLVGMDSFSLFLRKFYITFRRSSKPGVVVCAGNLRIWETEARGLHLTLDGKV